MILNLRPLVSSLFVKSLAMIVERRVALEADDVTQGDPEGYGPSQQTFKDRTFIGHGGAGDVDELAGAEVEEEVTETARL